MKTIHLFIRKFCNYQIFCLCLLTIIFSCKKVPAEQDPNYTNFRILSVKVINVPFKDEFNKEWDSLDGPDVYFNIEKITNTIKYSGISQCKNDISKLNLPLLWEIENGFLINDLNETNYIIFYDKDTKDVNDRMGFVSFNLSAHTSGYPKTISKSNEGLTISIVGEWF